MTTQINLKFQDKFFNLAKEYADNKGYMSIQELIRDALREKIFDDLEVREDYRTRLLGKVANTFSSEKDSKKFIDKLRKNEDL